MKHANSSHLSDQPPHFERPDSLDSNTFTAPRPPEPCAKVAMPEFLDFARRARSESAVEQRQCGLMKQASSDMQLIGSLPLL